ncbi:L-methionine transporter [Dacryopinax primogenitus]|uniref:L-methionine transporter n=1 Tax=Dacryopinax primogenitus (strain DJM 731) TaxID=1858805 RepID=M5GGJ6_DACPD|nr:L-methionine transporter [Dacryopinax primogenitus]EJU05603.1 L-methionine transporter [Dacryopinax primogenitus]
MSYQPLPSPAHGDHESTFASPRSSTESLRALEYSDGLQAIRPGRSRGYSISSVATFDFQNNLLPLSLTTELDDEKEVVGERTIGLFHAIALVVSLQIGSGIFSSPGVVFANVGSVGASMIVWLLSGILAWTGASSFAELGAMIPLNGGAQAYLAYAYNPVVSFMFSWTAIAVLKPGGNAIIALIFGEYMNRLFYGQTRPDSPPDAIPIWATKLTATVAVALVSLVCLINPKSGTGAALGFTLMKILALFAISIMGIVQLARGKASPSLLTDIFEGTSPNPSSWAIAAYSGLWAFDGWDQTNYVAGEMKHAERNLPRAIHISMFTVIILFLWANVSYFIVLDKVTVGRTNTIALDFGSVLFGRVGGIVFSIMVALSCFGALNGSFFTSARLIYVAGKEGHLPSLFGKLHRTRKTPVNAMILQAILTCGFILVGGGFRSLINFYSVAGWSFYGLTVMGLIVLRVKEPHLERPYKTWIITPLTFCAVALFLLSMPVIAAPLEALAAVGFILLGLPVYFITQRPNERIQEASSVLSRMKNMVASCLSCFSRGQSKERVRTATNTTEERVEMIERR